MLASSSLKAGLSSPAQGRDGEPEQRLKSEWWGWILISRVPCGQLHSEGQTNTPTLLHSPPGVFFAWKRLKRALHPAVRRLPLHPCVCVCARLTPPRVKRTHRTAALYDRRWVKERERERERQKAMSWPHAVIGRELRATAQWLTPRNIPQHWK